MLASPERISPPKPGDILKSFLRNGLGVTQHGLADAMKVSRFSINQIINDKRSITPEMAIRLGYVTGTTPNLWLNLQQRYDLFLASRKLEGEFSQLEVLRHLENSEIQDLP